VISDLAPQGGFEHPLRQLLQQPALPSQLQAFRPGPVHQHRDQLVIRHPSGHRRTSGLD
jgi:hypothetical protein